MSLDQTVNVTASDNAIWFLLTFSGPAGDLRVVNNLEDVSSRGQTFKAYPFSLNLMEDDGERQPEIQISIDNVDRMIVETLRIDTSPISVKLEVVVSNAPDVVEKSIDFLRLANVEYNALTVTGTLVSDSIMEQRFPYPVFSSGEFPDIFYR